MDRPQIYQQSQMATVPHYGVKSDKVILATPTWIAAIRALQILFSVVILGLCAWIIHGAYLDCEGFAIAVSVLTWVVLAYVIITEKTQSLHHLYHIFAVLGMELFLVIMWLSAMGAVAATRASFKYDVTIDECYNDGTLVSSNFCTISKRELAKRAVILTRMGQYGMVVTACLCALEFILFSVTFGWILKSYLQQRKSSTSGTAAGTTHEAKQPYPAAAQAPAPGHQFMMQPQQQPVMYQQPPQQSYAGHQQYSMSSSTTTTPMGQQYTGNSMPMGYPPTVSPVNSPAPQGMYGLPRPVQSELAAGGVSPEQSPHQGSSYPHVGPQEVAGHPPPMRVQELPTQYPGYSPKN